MAAAANPGTGEFNVPLKADALARMSKKMEGAEVDERMLNTVYAWIRKSDEDKLDGMDTSCSTCFSATPRGSWTREDTAR